MNRSRHENEEVTEPTTLGVIGLSPRGVKGPVRTSRFEQFQRLVGPIEAYGAQDYLAAHAVCHALMNGVSRTVFLALTDMDNPEAVSQAVTGLLAAEPLDLLVIPGLDRLDCARAAVAAFEQRAGDLDGPPDSPTPASLWLDAPRNADPSGAIAFRRALGGSVGRVFVTVPWVPTLTPGRRALELLPPSCLVAPLYLGETYYLKGVHELSGTFELSVREELRESGCALLVSDGPRRQIRLAFPLAREDRVQRREKAPLGLEERIAEDLRELCEPALTEHPDGPGLWKVLLRQARSVLMTYQYRGLISGYKLRCDAETNLDVKGGVAMEVWIKVPRRVKELLINVSVGRG